MNLLAATSVLIISFSSLFGSSILFAAECEAESDGRARGYSIAPGVLEPGLNNAITDVDGVLVGHVTLVEGENIRTGVTAILPHGGNVFQEKVPAGFSVGNAYGKFFGSTQIEELGEIETPIMLTSTLSVPEVAAGAIEWTLNFTDNSNVRSVNPVVGETNDGQLNDIRLRYVSKEHAIEAINKAAGGVVEEGNVGAGTGTHAFGWKGGIGTSSRVLPSSLGGWTIGVLVQTNFGGNLSVLGAPIGRDFGQFYLNDSVASDSADGSIIVVIATDAPLSDRNLERVARRSFNGIARTGSPMTNGSGDYAVAFSTAMSVRRTPLRRAAMTEIEDIPNDLVSPLFQAVVESTEEAIYNAMIKAESMTGKNGETLHELPIDQLLERLRHYRLILDCKSASTQVK